MSLDNPAPTAPGTITDEVVAAIAHRADVHPKTVVRALAGLPVRGRAGVRVARTIAAWKAYRAEAAAT